MRNFVVFLIPFALVVAACSSSVVGPASQPVSYGAYAGKVVLHGVNQYASLKQSGATVSLSGTSYSTTTDSNGNYVIAHVPTGTYTIMFTKQDFDTAMILGDRFSGIDTSVLLTQDLQLIPYDSVICDSAQFYFDDGRPTGLHDTVASILLFGRVLYPTVAHGEDSIYNASVKIVRENPSGDTTVIVSGKLVTLYPSYEGDAFQTYVDSTSMRGAKVRSGDKLRFYFRAACMPIGSSPLTLSPFVTRKDIIVQ
jgi:hypothetical protein